MTTKTPTKKPAPLKPKMASKTKPAGLEIVVTEEAMQAAKDMQVIMAKEFSKSDDPTFAAVGKEKLKELGVADDAADAGIGAPQKPDASQAKALKKLQKESQEAGYTPKTKALATQPEEIQSLEYITNQTTGSRYAVIGVGPSMYRLSINLRASMETWTKGVSIRGEYRIRVGDSIVTPDIKPMAKDIGLSKGMDDQNWTGGGEGYRSMAGSVSVSHVTQGIRASFREVFYPQLYESLKMAFPQFVLVDYDSFMAAMDSFLKPDEPPQDAPSATEWYVNAKLCKKAFTNANSPEASDAGL